jgi:branched-chain amino acid transport system ATP-binding protein
MLQVTNLTSGYGGIVAVRSASIKVPLGSMVCLIGANGAGKTTLLNTICGLVAAREGQVRLDGEDVTALPAHLIARRGLLQVPEGRQILGPLTVEENLRLGNTAASNRPGNIEAELDRVFALFPLLRERRSQIAAQLSGGQQQMLAIGRALLGRPRVLLLDEPSLGLAPNLVDQVYVALARLNQDGLSILVVEQNARRAMEVTNYAYVIDGGAIVMEGPSQEIRRNEDVISHYLGQTRD